MDYSVPGFRIQTSGENGSLGLIVEAREKQPWRARDAEAALCGDLLETTLEYRGENFRIVRETESAGGWMYHCTPWPPGESRFHVVKLDADAMRQEAEQQSLVRTVTTGSVHGAQYEILLGWLPLSVQHALSERWHFSPSEATRKNGVLEMFFGFAVVVPSALTGSVVLALVSFWFIFEGAARWLHGIGGESNGCGLLILEAPARLLGFLTSPRGK